MNTFFDRLWVHEHWRFTVHFTSSVIYFFINYCLTGQVYNFWVEVLCYLICKFIIIYRLTTLVKCVWEVIGLSNSVIFFQSSKLALQNLPDLKLKKVRSYLAFTKLERKHWMNVKLHLKICITLSKQFLKVMQIININAKVRFPLMVICSMAKTFSLWHSCFVEAAELPFFT